MALRKMTKEEIKSVTILSPVFRAAFVNVWKPHGMPGTAPEKMKYSITMLIPKDQDVSEIQRILHAVKVMQYGADKTKWPKLRSPIENGDQPQYTDKKSPKYREGYAGHWAIKVTTSQDSKPGVVGRDGKLITDQSDFYAGCYAQAIIWPRCYDTGNIGVQLILEHVQKVKDGPKFGGRVSAEAAFQPLADTGATDDFSGDTSEDDFK